MIERRGQAACRLGRWVAMGMLAWAATASGQHVLTNEHVDLNVRYTGAPTSWALTVRDADNGGIEYGPSTGNGDALLYVSPAAVVIRNPSPNFDFIGVGPNQPYWRLPQSQNPALLYLGYAAYGIPAGIIDSYDPTIESGGRVSGVGPWVRIRLLRMNGPGHFSVWQSGATAPNVFIATSDGIAASDSVWMLAGGHGHYNFGFTAPGVYEATFLLSAFENDGNPLTLGRPVWSCAQVVRFGVERTTIARVEGTVDLLDWGASQACQDVTLEIRTPGSPTPLQLVVLSTDANKNFSFALSPSIAPGIYDVAAKGSHWLRQTLGSVVVGANGATGLAFALINGDIDDDNEVSIGDYSLLSTAFGSDPSDPSWNAMADLNGDDAVDIGDFAILSTNFGLIGND